MDRYKLLITGGTPLRGETCVFGGKNTSVAVLPATLLCDEPCVVENLPDIEDVHVVRDMLELLGAVVDYDRANRRMTVDPRPVSSFHVPYQYTQRRVFQQAEYRANCVGVLEQRSYGALHRGDTCK